MNQTFSIGEVAIYWRPESPHHGKEVTILSNLTYLVLSKDVNTGEWLEPNYCYQITDLYPEIPGAGYWTHPKFLRKKRPPQELSSWDKVQEICGWNPEKQVNSII